MSSCLLLYGLDSDFLCESVACDDVYAFVEGLCFRKFYSSEVVDFVLVGSLDSGDSVLDIDYRCVGP